MKKSSISVICPPFRWLSRRIGPSVSGEGDVSGGRVNIGLHKTCHLMQETVKLSKTGTFIQAKRGSWEVFPRRRWACQLHNANVVLLDMFITSPHPEVGKDVVGTYMICKTQNLRLRFAWQSKSRSLISGFFTPKIRLLQTTDNTVMLRFTHALPVFPFRAKCATHNEFLLTRRVYIAKFSVLGCNISIYRETRLDGVDYLIKLFIPRVA